MYPNMKIKTVTVDGKEVKTCGEGYIVNRDEWSEGFVQAQAEAEQALVQRRSRDRQ